jgi:hypothetical protein
MENSKPPAYQTVSSDHMNIEMPEHVDQPTPPPSKQSEHLKPPNPNTAPPIQRVQPNSARLASPPDDYLTWSIVNTICSVPTSVCS